MIIYSSSSPTQYRYRFDMMKVIETWLQQYKTVFLGLVIVVYISMIADVVLDLLIMLSENES